MSRTEIETRGPAATPTQESAGSGAGETIDNPDDDRAVSVSDHITRFGDA